MQDAAFKVKDIKIVYDEQDRDKCVQSQRRGDYLTVYSLSVLATNKADLRWVLIGHKAKTKTQPEYKGVFLRGAGVYVLEIDAKLHDMPHVEAVLAATEDWARERRKRPMADDVKYGKRGGRPRKKRTEKHVAMEAWGDKIKYPTAADALASPLMKGWSGSAAARSIKAGGLGPRGGLVGRLPKPKST